MPFTRTHNNPARYLVEPEEAENDKPAPCLLCGQIDRGQTGEYPCVRCGVARVWDEALLITNDSAETLQF